MRNLFRVMQALLVVSLIFLTGQPVVAQSTQVPERDPNQDATFNGVLNSCLQFVGASSGDSGTSDFTDAQRDLFTRCSEMLSERDFVRQTDALDAMGREEASVVGSTITETSRAQLVNIQRRISTLRAMAIAQANTGSPGVALASADVSQATPDSVLGHGLSGRAFAKPIAIGGQGSGASGGGSSGIGWFINGEISSGERDATILEDGFDYDGYDITIGVDWSFGSSSFFGVAGGFKSAEADLLNSISDLETDGYSFSLYGGGGTATFIDYTVGYSQNNFESSTAIDYDITALGGGGINQINQFALGDTDGDELLASLTVGYSFGSGSFNFQPYLNGTYSDTSIDGYTETMIDQSAGVGLALTVADQDIESLTGAVGATLNWNISTGFGVVVPTLRAEWVKEFEDDPRRINTQLANAFDPTDPATLLPILTDPQDEDYFNITAGLNFVFVGGTQFYVLYHTIQDLDFVDFNGGTIGLRFEL